jgi:hypothetical protein
MLYPADHAPQAAALCAHTEYGAEQEVYDSYGPTLSPVDLLLDWGFVDPSNTNHRVDVDPTAIGEGRCGCSRPFPQSGQRLAFVALGFSCSL